MPAVPRLDLAVDRAGDLPLATQLAWKLRTYVATGALAPGDRLPGVRELAEAAGVNVNTVRSVYGRLEEEGLITSQHGRGTFVADHARPRETLARIASTAAEDARRAGVDPREVAAALFAGAGVEAPAAAPSATPAAAAQGSAGGERARRRELRAQIARLESELAYLEGLPPASGAVPRPDRGHLPDAAELEAIRDGLAARVTEVRDERARMRRGAEARRAGADAPAPEPRVWRHGGVWTGALKPGGVVYES